MSENRVHPHRVSEWIGLLETQLSDRTGKCSFATLNTSPSKDLSFFELFDRSQFGELLRTNQSSLSTELASSLDNPWNRNAQEDATQYPATSLVKNQSLHIRWLLEQAKLCCDAPDSPIVAVMGLLNAGKSSLVSTFLSEANRQRILVGSANAQGTHRFVLWMPESWRRDENVWSFVQARLRSIFGCDCELLADSADAAAAQYNDTNARSFVDAEGIQRIRPTIEIPLVATDPELDRWGIAIMDCPDVQTGLLPDPSADPMVSGQVQQIHEQAQSISELRWRVLRAAAPLCSAFVVVLPANAIHDQTVSRLMRLLQQQMSSVRQIVAVNRVPRRYTTQQISEEIQKIYGHHALDRQYMAYGFDGPLDREKIPEPPSFYKVPTLQPLPLFFRIDQKGRAQPPEPVATADWLLNLGSQLDKRSLANELLQSTLQQLQTAVREGISVLQRRERELKRIVFELQGTIAQACYEFSSETAKRSNQPTVRLQASKQIVQQISNSLERTAPWWARPSRWASRVADSTKTTIAKATSFASFPEWMRGTEWITGKATSVSNWIRSRWSSGEAGRVVTSDQLMQHLRQFDKSGALQLDRFGTGQHGEDAHVQRVRLACQRAIERFQNESNILLDDDQLDQFTRQVWTDMPMSRRLLTGLAPAGVLFAPLIAVIMMPLDFGGSAVLVFASLKELLFAGAAGVGLMLASANAMPQIAEAEVAWQQLGDLIAVLCDELGLRRPRESDGVSIRLEVNSKPISVSRIAPNSSVLNAESATGASLIPVEFTIQTAAVQAIDSTLGAIAQEQ